MKLHITCVDVYLVQRVVNFSLEQPRRTSRSFKDSSILWLFSAWVMMMVVVEKGGGGSGCWFEGDSGGQW